MGLPMLTPQPDNELDKETLALSGNPDVFVLSSTEQRKGGRPELSFNSKSQMSQIPGPSVLSATNENNSSK